MNVFEKNESTVQATKPERLPPVAVLVASLMDAGAKLSRLAIDGEIVPVWHERWVEADREAVHYKDRFEHADAAIRDIHDMMDGCAGFGVEPKESCDASGIRFRVHQCVRSLKDAVAAVRAVEHEQEAIHATLDRHVVKGLMLERVQLLIKALEEATTKTIAQAEDLRDVNACLGALNIPNDALQHRLQAVSSELLNSRKPQAAPPRAWVLPAIGEKVVVLQSLMGEDESKVSRTAKDVFKVGREYKVGGFTSVWDAGSSKCMCALTLIDDSGTHWPMPIEHVRPL